jgi:hypothetical protein
LSVKDALARFRELEPSNATARPVLRMGNAKGPPRERENAALKTLGGPRRQREIGSKRTETTKENTKQKSAELEAQELWAQHRSAIAALNSY